MHIYHNPEVIDIQDPSGQPTLVMAWDRVVKFSDTHILPAHIMLGSGI